MTGTGLFPITAPAAGASPLTTTVAGNSQADANNTNDVDNYAWGGVDSAPISARCMTTGAETYVITSGSVASLTGISAIDAISVAVNDLVFIPTAPGSSGVGAAISSGVGSSQSGNGLYYVTGLVGGNIQLARAATMSTTSFQTNPAGRVVFVRAGTVNAFTMWMVSSPVGVAAFTYGTTAMQWKNFFLNIASPTITTPTISSPTFTGTGIPNAAIQQAGINNFAIAQQSQATVAATNYYITKSDLDMPASPLTGMTANRTAFVWRISMAKNANGTGAISLILFRGTNGSTADTADVTQALGTQTAAADHMILDVVLVVTTTGATGAYYWTITPMHAAVTATGFGVATGTLFSGTKSSVAMNTASLKFGLGFVCATGGTLPTITVPMVQAFAYNMD